MMFEKEVAEKNKGYYLLIEGGNKIKCKECNKVTSLVENWYQHHRSTKREKRKQKK